MPLSQTFVSSSEGSRMAPLPGIAVRIMVYNEFIMMIEAVFEPDTAGAEHSHPHVQSSYIAEGTFEITIGNETRLLEAGASFIVDSNVVHSARSRDRGRLIETYTPMRSEFVP